ncbi:phosphopantetheine-binding protein [Ralstonia sp. R-29]|uniref:phosphopantetheine-binding protein n=1 Tax=Ralstonia sp. R-29 TaxID=3404059 RepID=UPI003CF71E90
MALPDNVCAALIAFISDSFLGDGTRIAADTPLLELNILDSAALFDVVDFVHRQFDIAIPVTEVHPDNFTNVSMLARLVGRLQAGLQPVEVIQ